MGTLPDYKPLLAPNETELVDDMFIQRDRKANGCSTSSIRNLAVSYMYIKHFPYVWKLRETLNFMKSTHKSHN